MNADHEAPGLPLGNDGRDWAREVAGLGMTDTDPANPHSVELASGDQMQLSNAQFARYAKLGVSPEIFLRHETILHDVDLVVESLDGSGLAAAFGEALKSRAADIATEAHKIRQGEQSDLTEAEVSRVQRDLAFMSGALTVILGARGEVEGREHGIATWMRSFRSVGLGRYEALYDTRSETWDDEGDFSGIVGDERDWAFSNGVPYVGTIKLEIDPSHRINISYVPDQDEAAAHYAQDVEQRKDGKARVYAVSDFSVRLDLDETAPEGLSLDVGRSSFAGEDFARPGDLVGRVMSASSPDGSHTYMGFSREMVGQFAPMAQDIIIHQYLRWKRVQDLEAGYQPSAEEEAADMERYMRNEGLIDGDANAAAH